MATNFRVTALAAVIGTCLAGSVLAPNAQAAGTGQQATAEISSYLIEFSDAGALYYAGGVANLRATAADPNGRARKFAASSPDAMAYREFLRGRQNASIANMSAMLGHPIDVTHTYEITQSGIAAKLTADEAAKIALMSDIKSIKKDEIYQLDTYRGPTFIGADSIWNLASPGGAINRGKGVVVGILDSGINSTHPSFADDASCGFGPSDHKLLSFRDCSTATAGVCNGPNPEAVDSGHGVHTASTAAGNSVTNAASPSPNLPASYPQMSGVAPCASLRTYKVCPADSCPGADILAGVTNAIIDGVDVINFSISGGTSPWSDNDRNFLDAVNADIVVAASAGNTSATVTNPVGQVNHRGPWVMTVAASTQDRAYGAGLSATGPGTPPANTQNLIAAAGSHTTAAVPYTGVRIMLPDPGQPITACDTDPAYPANYYNGAVALISRGVCSFYLKIDKAAAAGASAVVIYNNTFGSISMDTSAQTSSIPGYSITQVNGQAMNAFITLNGATPTITDLVVPAVGNILGDVLASFSFRGPTPGNVADLTKPDITGPGVNIYAAGRAADGNYFLLSGTSMSGPHLAGAAALVRAIQPTWTPAEVKSAIQLTAKVAGFKENEADPWNIDDVGNGRVQVNKAAFAGFVMDETYANYLASNPVGGSINIKTLNMPAVRNVGLTAGTPTYQWTRVLRNTVAGPTQWTVAVDQPPGVTVTVSPSSFTFLGDAPDHIFTDGFEDHVVPPVPFETQTITITATTTAATTGIAFGEINFTEAANKAPPAHITVAVKRQ